jgi:hypothetical protein
LTKFRPKIVTATLENRAASTFMVAEGIRT